MINPSSIRDFKKLNACYEFLPCAIILRRHCVYPQVFFNFTLLFGGVLLGLEAFGRDITSVLRITGDESEVIRYRLRACVKIGVAVHVLSHVANLVIG